MDKRCYHCGRKGSRINILYEYLVHDMDSIFACESCETRSNWNAVFIKDNGDVNTRNIGGTNG